jgi:hypothetical protein
MSDTLILNCPSCLTKVAVPAAARGTMAKCVKCGTPFQIPEQGDQIPIDKDLAEDIALELLEQATDQDDGTKVMPSLQDDHDEEQDESPRTIPLVSEGDSAPSPAAREPEDEPPDIGDESTPEEVKQLRRERHRLLLAVGTEAFPQILSPSFENFQERIRKIDKAIRRTTAWLEAVDRAGGENNPLAKRMDMNVDPTKATRQLAEFQGNKRNALRVLGEALITANQHQGICKEQRRRIAAVNEKLDELTPAPAKKKGLLSRLRGE